MTIKKTRTVYLLMAAIILASGVSATAIAAQSATGKRASNIKSKGNFDFENGKVTIYSSDLIYLADEIDLLEDTYKTETVKALNQIGTYFNSDGTSTHGKDDSNISSSEAKLLPYGAIIDGIIHSQSIPTERTYTGTMPGQTTETHGNISASTEANLSLGTAAWVEGKLIVGTGEDNFAYYTQGSQDGYNKGYTQGEKDGYNKGYAQGDKDGYNKGYSQGSQDGYSEGYAQGEKNATSSIERKDFSVSGVDKENIESLYYTIENTGTAYIALHMFSHQNYDCERGVSRPGYEVLIDGVSVFKNYPWNERAAKDEDIVNIDCFVNVEVTAGQVLELQYCGGYLCDTHLGGSVIIVY